jgi:glucosamine--fructose-6-phosphate aminotransferase (isomerizing)
MQESLTIQIEMAVCFITEFWRKVSNQASHLVLEGEGVRKVVLLGSGDSHHAALGLEMIFRTLAKRQVQAGSSMHVSRYLVPDLGVKSQETLLVGFSSSGEVARTVEALEMGNEIGAQTLAITSNVESTLAETASVVLPVELPDFPPGPGLLSYLGSMLAGYALAARLCDDDSAQYLSKALENLPLILERWMPGQLESGWRFAREVQDGTCVMVGGGPAFASALFGAAKVIEAAGERAWAQELEEWAHLEYFCEPANMNTWILKADGRCRSRETEVINAMQTIGRNLAISSWDGGEDWPPLLRESLAPLALWVAPTAYAAERSKLLDEVPFRGFGGGRDPKEGGGASRIRSSQRQDLKTVLHQSD